jgi:uncharacterized protein (DUF488 family)
MKEETLWTIGHSTLDMGAFLTLLKTYGIEQLVDVRSLPGSRRFPQFNKELLAISMAEAGLRYIHLPGLGGRRKANKNSKNTVWRNTSFRGYADYMETIEFKESASELMALARRRHSCIMCSEAVWWRCHRSMIADYLKSKGWKVMHIFSPTHVQEHPYTAAAKIIEGTLVYGSEAEGFK